MRLRGRKIDSDIIILLFILVAEFVWAFRTLVTNGFIAGGDFSGHLISSIYLFAGNWSGMQFPPLVPLITAIALVLDSNIAVYQILASASLALLVVPSYLIMRQVGVHRYIALPISVAYANTPAITNILAYGSFDRYVGIFFLLLAVYGLTRTLKNPTRSSKIIAVAAMVAAVASHPLALAGLVLGSIFSVVFVIAICRSLSATRSMLKVMIPAAIASLTMLPFYLPLFGVAGSAGHNPTLQAIATLNVGYFTSPFVDQFFPLPSILIALTILSLLGGLLMLLSRDPTRVMVTAFFLAMMALPFVYVQDQEVTVQFGMVFFYIGFGYFIENVAYPHTSSVSTAPKIRSSVGDQ